MNIRRITISVPARTASRIKQAAGGRSVSSWVTEVVEDRLEDAELERLWQEFYRDVNPNRRDVRAANALYQRLTKRRPKGA